MLVVIIILAHQESQQFYVKKFMLDKTHIE